MTPHKGKLALAFFTFAVLCLGTAMTARADIVYIGPFVVQPSGQGVVPTVLTLQSPGNTSNEAGSVARGNGVDIRTGDAVLGVNTKTVLFSNTGASSATDLGIFLDLVEPGNDAMLTLNTLVLTAYTNSGTVLGTFSYTGPALNLTATPGAGGGRSDHVFGLDTAQALELQGVLTTNPSLRLGLASSISNAQGGPDQFFFGARNVPQTPIPEPATMILLGTGLAGVAAKVRNRRKANKGEAA